MSRVTLWITVTMCLDVSCLTNLPDMYSDMVGDGVPMAMHSTVMLLPSITKFIGWTVGGCYKKYHIKRLQLYKYNLFINKILF